MEKKSQNKITKKESTTTTPARVYRNPFINFLMEFRKKNIGLSGQEVMQRAGEVWRKMSDNDKAPYYEMARRAPKRRKRRRRQHRNRRHTRHESSSSGD